MGAEKDSEMRVRGAAKRWMRTLALALAVGFLVVGGAWADEATFKLTIKDHRWDPAELVVPAGKTIKLEIHNADATPEEFESHVLNREKIIPAGATVVVYLGALQPGSYEFVGEFHEDTAKGKIVAK
jgi:plastocyanin